MTSATNQELIDWAIDKLEDYNREKKLYNLSAIILSVLDVICGITALFYTAMVTTSVVASILCGTIWSGRFIQLVKAERLAKSLKILSTASLAYIAVRKKRSEYMKNVIQAIKNNPLTLVFAIIGGLVSGFCGLKLIPSYIPGLPTYAYILIAIACALVAIAIVIILGWDGVKNAFLRNAKRVLSDENYQKVTELITTLESKQDSEKVKESESKALQKEVEKAQKIVDQYEHAKQVLEQAKSKENNV